MNRCIATMHSGERAEAWGAVNMPFLELYARRTGAVVHIDRTPAVINPDFPHITNEFMQLMIWKMELMRLLLGRYQRVLWIDADALVRPDCPDLFDLVPETHWAGVDAATVPSSVSSGLSGAAAEYADRSMSRYLSTSGCGPTGSTMLSGCRSPCAFP